MKRIAVDTSFFLFMIKRKVDMGRVNELYNEPVHFYTSKGVINELENIANSEKSDNVIAKMALKLIKSMNIEIINNEIFPDDWLLQQKDIATVDMPLSKKAVEKGIRVINITKSNKLVLR